MNTEDLLALLQVMGQLIDRVEQLQAQNAQLLEHERIWHEERKSLIEKNELARSKVEYVILRLKALEQN